MEKACTCTGLACVDDKFKCESCKGRKDHPMRKSEAELEKAAKDYTNQFSWNDPREEDAHEAFIAGYRKAIADSDSYYKENIAEIIRESVNAGVEAKCKEILELGIEQGKVLADSEAWVAHDMWIITGLNQGPIINTNSFTEEEAWEAYIKNCCDGTVNESHIDTLKEIGYQAVKCKIQVPKQTEAANEGS